MASGWWDEETGRIGVERMNGLAESRGRTLGDSKWTRPLPAFISMNAWHSKRAAGRRSSFGGIPCSARLPGAACIGIVCPGSGMFRHPPSILRIYGSPSRNRVAELPCRHGCPAGSRCMTAMGSKPGLFSGPIHLQVQINGRAITEPGHQTQIRCELRILHLHDLVRGPGTGNERVLDVRQDLVDDRNRRCSDHRRRRCVCDEMV